MSNYYEQCKCGCYTDHAPCYNCLEAQLQAAQAENKRLTQLLVKEIRFDGDDLNVQLGGEGAMIFMNFLVDLFNINGGENFLTMGLRGDGHSYAITIQNCDGELTPAQKMERLEAENAALRADCAELVDYLEVIHTDCERWDEGKQNADELVGDVLRAIGTLLSQRHPGASLLQELEALRGVMEAAAELRYVQSWGVGKWDASAGLKITESATRLDNALGKYNLVQDALTAAKGE